MALLGVNIDHVATLRQARKEGFPSVLAAAQEAILAGADGITAHLREDRRHIQDTDILQLKKEILVPLNLEMAVDPGIVSFAEKVRPQWTCLVPEKRQELTTEGGLDVPSLKTSVKNAIDRLQAVGVKVSLFIEPQESVVGLSRELGADAVELHTGAYARFFQKDRAPREFDRLLQAARMAEEIGLLVNAGHGLTYENIGRVAGGFGFHEFNIGFSIIARAIFVGVGPAVREMKATLERALCVGS